MALVLVLSGCASSADQREAAATPAAQPDNGAADGWEDDGWNGDGWDDFEGTRDPLEPMNRTVFAFNEFADTYAVRPAAVFYRDTVPAGARRSISNFLRNLGEPFNAGTNYLRGRGRAGTTNVMRFFINTTFGLFGLFDVAGAAGLDREPSDLGLTLGTWRVPEGPYLVLPLLGPSTIRDTTGLGGQYVTRQQHSPYYWTGAGTRIWVSATVAQGLTIRTELLSLDEIIEESGADRYVFMRESYLQHRREQLGEDDWDDWDDWDDADDWGGTDERDDAWNGGGDDGGWE